jgi:hypothetical protein
MSMFLKVLKELEYPPIYLISPEQFNTLDPDPENQLGSACGIAAKYYPVICINPGMHGKERLNVIWHEVGHHLFPWKPHWWIECFANRMARGGGTGVYSIRYKKNPDMLPDRRTLLEMAKRSAKRLRKKYRVNAHWR